MADEGATLVKHYRELAYMGFVPVLLHLRTILGNMRQCKEDIAAWRPDVVILVDYPGFNLSIAKYVKAQDLCPVYYYISPKIWNTASNRSVAMSMSCSRFCLSRCLSSKRNTIIPSTMWVIPRKMKWRNTYQIILVP